MDEVERLIARAEDDTTGPDVLRATLDELLARSPGIGAAVALGLLAREPRERPSRRLLIDPGDESYRRWRRRVAAAAVLLASPAVPAVAAVHRELRAELADCRDLETDARSLSLAQQGSLGPQ